MPDPLWRDVAATGRFGSVAAALRAAGLDYGVETRPLWFQHGDERRAVDGRRVVVRTDTGEALGVVGARYRPWPAVDALAFGDDLAALGPRIVAAGDWTFRRRQRIFVVLRYDTPTRIVDDEYDVCLFLLTSHDGTKARRLEVAPVHRATQALLRLPMPWAPTGWQLKHTARDRARAGDVDAVELARRAFAGLDATADALEELAEVPTTRDELAVALHAVNGSSGGARLEDRHVAQIVDGLDADEPTRYDALLRLCAWSAWERTTTSPASRFPTNFEGHAAAWREAMFLLMTGRR